MVNLRCEKIRNELERQWQAYVREHEIRTPVEPNGDEAKRFMEYRSRFDQQKSEFPDPLGNEKLDDVLLLLKASISICPFNVDDQSVLNVFAKDIATLSYEVLSGDPGAYKRLSEMAERLGKQQGEYSDLFGDGNPDKYKIPQLN